MKNEILDDIFTDELRNQLEPSEKVIWDGKPSITPYTKWSNILIAIIMILSILNIYLKGWDFSAILTPIVIYLMTFWRLYTSRKIRYLITDQRIIFQLWENKKKQFHTIHLDQIKKILITDEDKKNGTIFLPMKNKKTKSFKTHNLKNNDERPYLSLEMIENVDEIAEYIELGMQKRIPQ